jgi:hypothetical protein
MISAEKVLAPIRMSDRSQNKLIGWMAVYSAKAVLQGKGRDVWEMMMENIP